MKALDLLFMIITVNILYMILSGIGCYAAPGTVSINLNLLLSDGFFGITGGSIAIAGGLAALATIGKYISGIGSIFAVAFLAIWVLNISTIDAQFGISNIFPWFITLFSYLVGPLLAIMGALEFQTGVKL